MKELLNTRETAAKDYNAAWSRQEKVEAEMAGFTSKGRADKAEKLEPQRAAVRECVAVWGAPPAHVFMLVLVCGVLLLLGPLTHRPTKPSRPAESAWTTSRRVSFTWSRVDWGACPCGPRTCLLFVLLQAMKRTSSRKGWAVWQCHRQGQERARPCVHWGAQ